MLLADFHLFQAAEASQAHVQDGFCLGFAQGEVRHQAGFGLVFLADDADDVVDVEVDDQVAVQHLDPAFDRRQTVVRSPHQHVMAVVEPAPQHLRQRHDPRRPRCIQHVHIQRKSCFQGGDAEHRLHQHVRFHAAGLGFQHQADDVAAFVADVAKERKFLLLHQLRHMLDQLVLLHLIGDFGDHDGPGAVQALLHRPFGAQAEAAAAGLVGGLQGCRVFDQYTAGGEVRAGHVLQQVGGGGVGILNQMQRRAADLPNVVGWDGGRHAHGNARRAVGQQVGKSPW